MEIIKNYSNQLRNNEHFQFHSEFKKLVEEHTAEKLKITELFAAYLPLYQAEDEAIVKITKSSFTEQREDADRQRDNTFRGMVDANKSSLNHFDPEVVVAAKRLKILFDTYGNVARLPQQEETSAISNLIADTRDKYADEISRAMLNEWVEKLEADNQAYDLLMKQTYDEAAARTELTAKETRSAVDDLYRQIVERVEALTVVEGEAEYEDFVRSLNQVVEKYRNLLAQRQGVAKAKRE